MRGLNRVVISGNVGSKIAFNPTGNGTSACSFFLTSDRYSSRGVVSARAKINVYGEEFVRICRARLEVGVYVLVEGELMNRDGQYEELVEVRAKEIIFMPRPDTKPEETKYDG